MLNRGKCLGTTGVARSHATPVVKPLVWRFVDRARTINREILDSKELRKQNAKRSASWKEKPAPPKLNFTNHREDGVGLSPEYNTVDVGLKWD